MEPSYIHVHVPNKIEAFQHYSLSQSQTLAQEEVTCLYLTCTGCKNPATLADRKELCVYFTSWNSLRFLFMQSNKTSVLITFKFHFLQIEMNKVLVLVVVMTITCVHMSHGSQMHHPITKRNTVLSLDMSSQSSGAVR